MIKEQFLTLDDAALWSDYLPASRSVFGSVGYARVCAGYRGVVPRLYVAENGGARICYPILLRSLENLPFAAAAGPWRWDTTTPEFTGPNLTGKNMELMRWFERTRDEAFRREGIVAEFAHLHPWAAGWQTLMADGCINNREIVWVDTRIPPREMWHDQFEHACRKNINTAYRNSVRVFTASSDDLIEEFHRIYTGTMARIQAQAACFYPISYFRALRDELAENCRFTFASHNGRIVAATLYLHDAEDVYSYLGGAEGDAQHLRPTNAVIWETIMWAHEMGKLRLVLGGGYKPDDAIFRFKRTFSKKLKSSHIFRRVHDETTYGQLELRCRDYFGLDGTAISCFPSYRYERRASAPVEVDAAPAPEGGDAVQAAAAEGTWSNDD